MSIFDAAMAYQAEGTPLMIIAGKSTAPDRVATGPPKATTLLGVKAVLVESYERIHRANLVGHGRAAAAVPERRQCRDLRP